VEQLLFTGVYKDSAGKVQMASMNDVRLTVAQAEYTDPANANDRWIQGTLNADNINLADRDTAQKIFVNTEQGNDTIVGHAGQDIIKAGGGTNTISAGAGDDTIVITHSTADQVDGGDGKDTLRFELAGNNKKVTVDAAGNLHIYSATGTWTNGFSPDSNGWVERYQVSSDYGTDGTNRIGVYDLALKRVVARVKNVEQLQWRLDDNLSERATNTLKVGTNGDDTLSGADVVLAGAGNDTITLNSNTLRIGDGRNGTRPVLIDGGAGRDVLQLDGTIHGSISF
jgi:Ca2+-binding RTX toxin-like protein